MKRIFFLILCAWVLLPGVSQADVVVMSVPWTSTAGGTFTKSISIKGTITNICFFHGTATDLYDVVLTKPVSNYDVLEGAGANLAVANNTCFVPFAKNKDGDNGMLVMLDHTLTLSISNAGAATSGIVEITFK